MSGGALDYAYCQLEDPIKEIEDRIKKNGKTIQQLWDEKSEEEKKNAVEWGHDWEIPWNKKNIPDNVRAIAEEEAWENFNHNEISTKKERAEWQSIYDKTLKEMIDAHNSGIENIVYSPETIQALNKMLETIKRAKIYLKRIEWLFSGDDGEADYIARTKEDLEEAGL